MTATAHLTATEGPLRHALTELARLGIGERIVKSAIAATLAWLVADQLPRENAPFVAALTAVYTIDLTILKSLRSAGQRLAGIAIGIALAFAAAEVLGIHSWSVGLVILLSLVVGLRLNLKPEGMTQVAGTAIVVMVVRATTEERSVYSLTFLADTAIGTAVGLGINGLIAPPSFLPAADRALGLLTDRLTELVDELAGMVGDGLTAAEASSLSSLARAVQADLAEVDESLTNAEESVRFNPVARRQRDAVNRFHALDAYLELIVTNLRRLIDSLEAAATTAWMTDRSLTDSLANLISAVAVGLTETTLSVDAELPTVARSEIAELLTELKRQAARIHEGLSDDSWMSLGGVVESAAALADSVGVDRAIA
jgi:uncharacterized membrane protein YgaE (UPF0421/DUF939 family)